jgi:hypothetical protein
MRDGDFLSINPYRTETMLGEEICKVLQVLSALSIVQLSSFVIFGGLWLNSQKC